MAERTKDLVVSVLGKRAAAVALTLDRGNRHRADQVATVAVRRPMVSLLTCSSLAWAICPASSRPKIKTALEYFSQNLTAAATS
jgi:hypothetical protein